VNERYVILPGEIWSCLQQSGQVRKNAGYCEDICRDGTPCNLVEEYLAFRVPCCLYNVDIAHCFGSPYIKYKRSRVRFPIVSLEYFIDIILQAAL
jgi:hypothetical protein